MREYLPLGSYSPALAGAWMLARPSPARVTLDSPALDVMTDFAQVPAATIERSASLATANDYMVTHGVRSLFVVTPDGRLAGLVTTTDLIGDRAVRASHARGVRRHELTVGDVMTAAEDMVALMLEDVRSAKVGHVVASLKQAGRHHELAAEALPGGEVRIRGMFSVSQIARQLGMPLQISELARTARRSSRRWWTRGRSARPAPRCANAVRDGRGNADTTREGCHEGIDVGCACGVRAGRGLRPGWRRVRCGRNEVGRHRCRYPATTPASAFGTARLQGSRLQSDRDRHRDAARGQGRAEEAEGRPGQR